MPEGEQRPGKAGEARRPGCLRTGCLGCGAVAGVLVFLVVAFGIVLMLFNPPPPDRVVGELSAPPGVDAVGAEREPGAPLAVHCHVRWATVRIRVGEPGRPLTITADHDQATHDVRRVDGQAADGSELVSVVMGPRVSWVRLAGENAGESTILDISLPAHRPVHLVAIVDSAVVSADLGGAWLESIHVRARRGAVGLAFREPTQAPVEWMRLDVSSGAVTIHGLGNASPRRADVRNGLGATHVGLEGRWRGQTALTVETSGSGELHVPHDTPLFIDEADSAILARLDLGDMRRVPDLEPGAPAVHLGVRARFGNLRLFTAPGWRAGDPPRTEGAPPPG